MHSSSQLLRATELPPLSAFTTGLDWQAFIANFTHVECTHKLFRIPFLSYLIALEMLILHDLQGFGFESHWGKPFFYSLTPRHSKNVHGFDKSTDEYVMRRVEVPQSKIPQTFSDSEDNSEDLMRTLTCLWLKLSRNLSYDSQNGYFIE